MHGGTGIAITGRCSCIDAFAGAPGVCCPLPPLLMRCIAWYSQCATVHLSCLPHATITVTLHHGYIDLRDEEHQSLASQEKKCLQCQTPKAVKPQTHAYGTPPAAPIPARGAGGPSTATADGDCAPTTPALGCELYSTNDAAALSLALLFVVLAIDVSKAEVSRVGMTVIGYHFQVSHSLIFTFTRRQP